MNNAGTTRVYEQIATADLAAEGIRPGGLRLTERALTWCRFPPGARVLDVGCGTGVTLDRLSRVYELAGIGLDASAALLHQSRIRNSDLLLVRAAGENLPFLDEYADGVLAECSLSAMSEIDTVLDEFRRVLKTSAKLILSDVYARDSCRIDALSRVPESCCLRGAISREQLTEKLTRRGFGIVRWEDHSDLLKDFAVQLIFSYGSMNQFWCQAGSEFIDPTDIQRSISEARPGYYLLLAQKLPG